MFKKYTFEWWQVGIIKLALLSLGIIIGTYWGDLFLENILLLWALFGISAIYLIKLVGDFWK